MKINELVFFLCVVSFTFFLGYGFGLSNQEVKVVKIPDRVVQPCLTAPEVKKLYYAYGRDVRRIKSEYK